MVSGIAVWVFVIIISIICVVCGGIVGVTAAENKALLFAGLLIVFCVGAATVYTSQSKHPRRLTATVDATSVGESCSQYGCSYFVDVDYTYTYEEQRYSAAGKKSFNSRIDAEQWADVHSAGNTMHHYIYPNAPSQSYLNRPSFIRLHWWKIPAGAFGFFWIGGWLLTVVEIAFSKYIIPFARETLVIKQ